MEMKRNTLYFGDCLEIMKGVGWKDESVDLVYLDPPFNSDTNYNILFGREQDKDDRAQFEAFADTWEWNEIAAARLNAISNAADSPIHDIVRALKIVLGESGMLAYLLYMADRLVEMHRLLKPSGSIYLHCDPTASHYLKLVMDAIFGKQNFRNEIIWRIGWVSGFKTQKRGWIRNHDTILYYVMSDAAKEKFNKEYIPYPEEYVRRDGQRPTGKGIPIEDTWNCSAADILDSIMIKSFSREKLGYPTQKPRALLERIIKASSNPGDLVLDPFCGCGTTIDAAIRTGRDWIGIDISTFAIELIREKRLQDRNIPTLGIPRDMEGARKLMKEKRGGFIFEIWAASLVAGIAPNKKQIGDRGVDGKGYLVNSPQDGSNLVLVQIKGGRFVPEQLRAFLEVMERDKAAMGIFITMDKVNSAQAREDMIRKGSIKIGASEYPRIQCWSIAEHFEGIAPKLPPMRDPRTGEQMEGKLL